MDDIREKAEALIKLVEKENPKWKGYMECHNLLKDEPAFLNLKASLRPSREELADEITQWKKFHFTTSGIKLAYFDKMNGYFDLAIEELRK